MRLLRAKHNSLHHDSDTHVVCDTVALVPDGDLQLLAAFQIHQKIQSQKLLVANLPVPADGPPEVLSSGGDLGKPRAGDSELDPHERNEG